MCTKPSPLARRTRRRSTRTPLPGGRLQDELPELGALDGDALPSIEVEAGDEGAEDVAPPAATEGDAQAAAVRHAARPRRHAEARRRQHEVGGVGPVRGRTSLGRAAAVPSSCPASSSCPRRRVRHRSSCRRATCPRTKHRRPTRARRACRRSRKTSRSAPSRCRRRCGESSPTRRRSTLRHSTTISRCCSSTRLRNPRRQ